MLFYRRHGQINHIVFLFVNITNLDSNFEYDAKAPNKRQALSVYFYLCTTVYPKKYAHGFVVLCFLVVMQSFIMNSHEVFIHIHQGCFAGTGAIVRLPQCQWSKLDGYGKISQCITTIKHSKAKTLCIFLGIYCRTRLYGDRHKHLQEYLFQLFVNCCVLGYCWRQIEYTAQHNKRQADKRTNAHT